jgi:hypothetical protein
MYLDEFSFPGREDETITLQEFEQIFQVVGSLNPSATSLKTKTEARFTCSSVSSFQSRKTHKSSLMLTSIFLILFSSKIIFHQQMTSSFASCFFTFIVSRV